MSAPPPPGDLRVVSNHRPAGSRIETQVIWAYIAVLSLAMDGVGSTLSHRGAAGTSLTAVGIHRRRVAAYRRYQQRINIARDTAPWQHPHRGKRVRDLPLSNCRWCVQVCPS